METQDINQISGPAPLHPQRIYSVSELTQEIKYLLEEKFSFIWINGEISNLRMPTSGHLYFTLKDQNAQINAVMFRGQNRNLKFTPEDGMHLIGLGRLSVYEPRGNYQIIFEYLEPKGIGALQIAFEQLKTRLSEEGLFDDCHKRHLPYLPKKISVITSPSGAVIHDILRIINRRFANIHVEIVSAKVQGDGAEKELVSGIEWLNSQGNADIIILARGGGSLEDLHAFNSEKLARVIFSSKIPVISAIGHETDFTIADFVADLRAPTPSAAAELAVPLRKDLVRRCTALSDSMINSFYRYLEQRRGILNQFSNRLIDPQRKIQDLRLRLDDTTARMIRLIQTRIYQKREHLGWRQEKLAANNPRIRLNEYNLKLEQNKINIFKYMVNNLNKLQYRLREQASKLNAMSPTAILDRGYSITRTIPGARVVRDPKSVSEGQDLEVMVAKGSLAVNVIRRKPLP
ncbi:exodeoxyribonuclease VII large subunit [Thermodesulfobacteriota bacterium]